MVFTTSSKKEKKKNINRLWITYVNTLMGRKNPSVRLSLKVPEEWSPNTVSVIVSPCRFSLQSAEEEAQVHTRQDVQPFTQKGLLI